MSRLSFATVALLLAAAVVPSAPVPKEAAKLTGVLVLDDCDRTYMGKDKYDDNLTLVDGVGKEVFRVTGINNCQSISSSRMIAVDLQRKSIWIVEIVACRIRRFDLTGKEKLSIYVSHASAVAVDPDTGNVWAMVNNGNIGTGQVDVYDPDGKKLATHDIPGWDIVYDKKAKAFWIGGQKLTKIAIARGEVLFSKEITDYSIASMAVDSNSGSLWASVRHKNIDNEMRKFDADGDEVHRIDMKGKSATRVSIDQKNGSMWVANKKSVERFSADGKLEVSHAVEALAVQVDPTSGDVWVVTPTEVQRMTPKGEVKARAAHAGKTSQAWITAIE